MIRSAHVLVFLLLTCFAPAAIAQVTCDPPSDIDRDKCALLEINTYYDNKLEANWADAYWSGVKFNDEGRATQLILHNKAAIKEKGSLPVAIGQLTELTHLLLTKNDIKMLPEDFWKLTKLEYLNLEGNQLTEIPAQIGNLTNLKELLLDKNQLSGEIPAQIGNLTNLWRLWLKYNNLSGEIPAQIGMLTNLAWIELNENQLIGAIPAKIGQLTNLEFLFLGSNLLSGAIPTEIGELTKLQILDLQDNQLTGEIPAEIGQLTNLGALALNGNELSGEIPAEIGNLTNLEQLWIYGTLLHGAIPPEIGNLTNLQWLTLKNNDLSGAIPAEIGNLTNLAHLDVRDNYSLIGYLPIEMTDMTSLSEMNVTNTNLCNNPDPKFTTWAFDKVIGLSAEDAICQEAAIELACTTNKDNSAHKAERQALRDLLAPDEERNENWNKDKSIREWAGVVVDAQCRIVELDLYNKELTGNIPESFKCEGTNGAFCFLKVLDVSGNPGLTKQMPASMTTLNLEGLDYSGTGLCAPAEDTFSNWEDKINSEENKKKELGLFTSGLVASGDVECAKPED